jgi:hypothetical protein
MTENTNETDLTTSRRADGTVYPPVTPDPPNPPGYRSPLDDSPALRDLFGAESRTDRSR